MRDRLLDRWENVAILERELIDQPTPALQQAVAEQCPSGRFVSHILVESGVEAQAVLQELAGGADFADVAERESVDQGSVGQGGSLGCIDGQDFIEPFATVAATQPIGEVSDPFTTDFGTHVVLVSDEPPASALASAALEQVLNRARGEDVDLNDRYGIWDERNGQVVPAAIPAQAPAAAASG
jgi:peptidyl-prolyl cis-trans isomerase C